MHLCWCQYRKRLLLGQGQQYTNFIGDSFFCKYMRLLILLLIVLVFVGGVVTAVSTDEVHSITLLSVTGGPNETYKGGVANLYLQVKQGQGAIFVESYPLAKLDTQVSIRFANEVACEFSNVDCEKYDFFYTIRAGSPIVGGPSGGGATALLTLAVLEEVDLKEDFAMTGSISSGGIIGAVAGVAEKVEAAASKGKKLAIVPALSLDNNTFLSLDNKTLTVVSLEALGIIVEPVISLDEALEFAAVSYEAKKLLPIIVDDAYLDKMELTVNHLCTQSKKLLEEIEPTNNSLYVSAEDFYNKSLAINDRKNYYSKASFCYSANLRFRDLIMTNLSQHILQENYDRLIEAQNKFEKDIKAKPLRTFTDLETSVIVTERLLESRTYLKEINQTNISSSLLAYAIERYESAVAWSGFFGLPGDELQLDDLTVRVACLKELEEVETRMNYLRTLLPETFLEGVTDELDKAYEYRQDEEPALCLFKATKAKAHANLFFATLGLVTNSTTEIALAKIQRAGQVIASQDKGFPILGYSYYVYANELSGEDDYSSLLFSEYALGMSDISRYFPRQQESLVLSNERITQIGFFAIGLFLGMLIMLIIIGRRRTKPNSRKKRR